MTCTEAVNRPPALWECENPGDLGQQGQDLPAVARVFQFKSPFRPEVRTGGAIRWRAGSPPPPARRCRHLIRTMRIGAGRLATPSARPAAWRRREKAEAHEEREPQGARRLARVPR